MLIPLNVLYIQYNYEYVKTSPLYVHGVNYKDFTQNVFFIRIYTISNLNTLHVTKCTQVFPPLRSDIVLSSCYFTLD